MYFHNNPYSEAVTRPLIPLVAAPAVPLDSGLDDVLGVGGHPRADAGQAPGWNKNVARNAASGQQGGLCITKKQPQVVILTIPGKSFKRWKITAKCNRFSKNIVIFWSLINLWYLPCECWSEAPRESSVSCRSPNVFRNKLETPVRVNLLLDLDNFNWTYHKSLSLEIFYL